MAAQRDLFAESRLNALGGSDMGALYNLDFGCQRALWYTKRSTPQDFPKENRPEFERGHLLEPVARALYEARTGRSVELRERAVSKQYPWLAVSVDGETTAPEHEGPGYVEFKVVNRFIFKRFLKEGLRDSYILQLQEGMLVKGYQWGSFGILCLDPWDFKWFDVERDQALINVIIESSRVFWSLVQNGPTPEALADVKDKRCATCPWRRTCRGNEFLAAVPDSSEKEGVVSDPGLLPLVQEVIEAKSLTAEAKELEDAAVAVLKTAIGDRYGVIVPGFRALFPTSYPERWDTKALAGLYEHARTIINTEREDWDLDSLEDKCTELLQIIVGLSKAKKAPKPERSLRIYATGD